MSDETEVEQQPCVQRPFRPEALDGWFAENLRPRMGPENRAWRYMVVVPAEQVTPSKKLKATLRDINQLETMLVRHFCGVTLPPSSLGLGLRDPRKPTEEPERNYNCFFVVYASPLPAADDYFRALQTELQIALCEGVILIEKQEVLLL